MDKDKIIMYAPEGELHDSVQASGVLDISDLSRKEIKKLARNAASWSGENGTFSWQDVASGQADVQGRFTRHENLFKTKFNQQLNRNLRHTAKMQEIENAKNGDVTALGRYQNYAKDDVAKVLAPLVVGVPAIGTGVASTLAGGVKSFYANPWLRWSSDMFGTGQGIKNAFSDDGISKTIRLAQEGDTWGAIKSGAGDVFDILSLADLPQSFKAVKNYRPTYKFKNVDNIGDGSTRWNSVNNMDIDQTYQRYVRDGIVDEDEVKRATDYATPYQFDTDDNLEDFIFFNDDLGLKNNENIQWLVDNLQGKTRAEANAFLKEISNEASPHYGKYLEAKDKSIMWGIYPSNHVSAAGKKAIVEQGRDVEKAIDFVEKGIHTRNPATRGSSPGATFVEQLKANLTRYRKPNFKFDFTSPLTSSKYDPATRTITMGWTPPGTSVYLPGEKAILDNRWVAAHEAAHANKIFNDPNYGELALDDVYNSLTDAEKKEYLKKLRPDSPYYQNDYSKISQRHKDLLTPSKSVDDHDFEISEGYSDDWSTRDAMHNKGISSAALHPTKKYNYFDLFRYKMTPAGMTDRFIRQRGGWWRGWKQQLDALNEVYKSGGKLNNAK